MKTMIYSMLVALVALCNVACDSKNDEQAVISGSWNYDKPHFEFEYATDTVRIEMYPGKGMSIAVEDLRGMFMGTANEKMGAYFAGVEFGDKGRMAINMKMQGGRSAVMHADYKQSADIIHIELDSNDLKQMTNGKAPKIPPISFKYEANGDVMLMYFNLVYAKTMFAMMQNQLVDMIIPMMGIDLSHIPAEQLTAMKAGIKMQISGILDKTRKLEIGFNMKRM